MNHVPNILVVKAIIVFVSKDTISMMASVYVRLFFLSSKCVEISIFWVFSNWYRSSADRAHNKQFEGFHLLEIVQFSLSWIGIWILSSNRTAVKETTKKNFTVLHAMCSFVSFYLKVFSCLFVDFTEPVMYQHSAAPADTPILQQHHHLHPSPSIADVPLLHHDGTPVTQLPSPMTKLMSRVGHGIGLWTLFKLQILV